MTGKKLSELPDFNGKELALEVQRRGALAVGLHIDRATEVMLIGLIQVVDELRAEIKALKEAIK